MSSGIPVPGGEVDTRPLQFFYIVDYSGSMAGRKMQIVNAAIREAIPAVISAVSSHPNVSIMVRAIKFSNTASWHVGPVPVPINEFKWPELTSAGSTATAQAINLLASELTLEKMPKRGYPPVCILVSDGCCTEEDSAYETAIKNLLDLPWGRKAVRLAIGIRTNNDGVDGYDEKSLLKFVSQKEVGVLDADTPEKLKEYIVWSSVTASVSSSSGRSALDFQAFPEQAVVMPPPPDVPKASSGEASTW
jgi:uncharacterized protein YegL